MFCFLYMYTFYICTFLGIAFRFRACPFGTPPAPLWATLGPCGPGPLRAAPLWASLGPCGFPRDLVGLPGPLQAGPVWAPLGPCGSIAFFARNGRSARSVAMARQKMRASARFAASATSQVVSAARSSAADLTRRDHGQMASLSQARHRIVRVMQRPTARVYTLVCQCIDEN